MDKVAKVASLSKNLKGTCRRALEESALTVGVATTELDKISAAKDAQQLEEENL